MKNRTLKQITKQLEIHRSAIAKERDAMRELIYEIESLLEPVEDGLTDLEFAIEKFSEQA